MSDETLPPEVAAGTAAGSATAPVEGEERAHRPPPRFLHGLIEANIAVVTVCAAFAGLFFGAILICVTTPTVNQAFGHLFSNPGHAFGTAWSTVAGAYSPMIEGSLIDPHALAHAISSGTGWNTAFTPISETLVSATPLMLAGLGVGLGFSTGVFNIGAQGQYIGGALAALYVGFQFHLPIGIHLPLVIIAGAVGGGIVGFVPGFLKAQTGAHEVITTIMLNYIMIDLSAYLLTVQPFQLPGQANQLSKFMPTTAQMPHLFGSGLRVNLSLVVALAMAALMVWFTRRSRLGFTFKVIGLNPDAGKTAGMDVRKVTMLVMAMSGALAGMAGMATLSGTDFQMASQYGGELGFSAITVALLGRNKPEGIVFASLLFGALETGGRSMQAAVNVPLDLSTVIEAIVVFFVATPALVREVFRLRDTGVSVTRIASGGWGS